MIDFEPLYTHLQQSRLHPWVDQLRPQLKSIFETVRHGKHEEWEDVLKQLPKLTASHYDYMNTVSIGTKKDIGSHQEEQLTMLLQQLNPWRKGPFDLFGIDINTEWHSDWKWDRIKDHFSPLDDKLVLHIGCGNGYHMWRMLGAKARLVVGADPSRLFLNQFAAIKHFMQQASNTSNNAGKELPIHLLPLRGEDLPDFNGQGFDTVFSMGVLYHRKSPFNHLQELKSFLKPGGELVLETLVIEGGENSCLVPENRYAKMRNVWFIPSVSLLERWLKRLGFKDIKVADINQTSIAEQRATPWMGYESLTDFLDPDNSNLTIEGYPAPLRACLVCKR